jgi:hypothetical protein
MATNAKILNIMREAIQHSESGSSFIVKAPILGAREETIQFSASKGDKVLCAIGIETSLAVTAAAWGAGNCVANATKQAFMLDDLRIKIDNQLRIDSSDAQALIEWADLVLNRVQSDTVLAANGVARSYHLIPVSAVGGSDVLVDIDYASFTEMYTAGGGVPVEGAKTIVLTPYYSSVSMPIWGMKTGSVAFSTTGNNKVQIDSDYLGNGFLQTWIGLPSATTLDDFTIKQSDGLELFNAKYLATSVFWQNQFIKTVATNSWGVHVESTHPWTLNDRVQIDVSGGTPTVHYAVVFLNSPSLADKGVSSTVSTPREMNQPQPQTVNTTGRLDRNQIINNPAQRRGFVGGVKDVLGI